MEKDSRAWEAHNKQQRIVSDHVKQVKGKDSATVGDWREVVGTDGLSQRPKTHGSVGRWEHAGETIEVQLAAFKEELLNTSPVIVKLGEEGMAFYCGGGDM